MGFRVGDLCKLGTQFRFGGPVGEYIGFLGGPNKGYTTNSVQGSCRGLWLLDLGFGFWIAFGQFGIEGLCSTLSAGTLVMCTDYNGVSGFISRVLHRLL